MPAYEGTAMIRVKLVADDHDEAVNKMMSTSEWEDWDVIGDTVVEQVFSAKEIIERERELGY